MGKRRCHKERVGGSFPISEEIVRGSISEEYRPCTGARMIVSRASRGRRPPRDLFRRGGRRPAPDRRVALAGERFEPLPLQDGDAPARVADEPLLPEAFGGSAYH